MSYRQTYVVEYETENDAPRVSANMECMGGKLVVVQFGDMNEDVRKGRAGRLRAIPVEVGVD